MADTIPMKDETALRLHVLGLTKGLAAMQGQNAAQSRQMHALNTALRKRKAQARRDAAINERLMRDLYATLSGRSVYDVSFEEWSKRWLGDRGFLGPLPEVNHG